MHPASLSAGGREDLSQRPRNPRTPSPTPGPAASTSTAIATSTTASTPRRPPPIGVHLADGGFLPSASAVWVAGVRASPLAEVGVEQGRAGQVRVPPDLCCPATLPITSIGMAVDAL